jgi:16S rRNA C967 or C1407 C5-methylase (RsmB/RsmF family)/NOL1/NOP2/fmu family ribosome biogenesis protein
LTKKKAKQKYPKKGQKARTSSKELQEKVLPSKFLAYMNKRLGEEFPSFLEALDQKPPVSVRINPDKYPELLSNEDIIPWCSEGRYLSERPAFVWDPLYHAGAYYAQEASSMFFANLIDFSKPLKVLDLCAAPGGKSSLILSKLKKGSILVSNELVGKRAAILNENLVKWSSARSIVTSNRVSDFVSFEGFFDVVLVDAPCSGEGMFRKDDGAIAQWSENLVNQCSTIQKEILDDAIHLLAVGGTLIYSTCTFEARENEENINRLFEKNKNILEPINWKPDDSWGLYEVDINSDGLKGFYSYPHKVKGEGLFLTGFHKKDNEKAKKRQQKGQLGIFHKPDIKLSRIIEGWISISSEFEAFLIDNEVWILPSLRIGEIAHIFEKLNIRKLGVKAGTIIRDDFIPDHALAMSSFVNQKVPRFELNKVQALEFMQRKNLQLPDEVSQGWILLTYNGIGIGWVKNLGNRINNHYPAEWRIRKEPRLNEVFIPEEDQVSE